MKHPNSPIGVPAYGPLRTSASALCVALARGPRAVPCRGLGVAALAFSEGALRCSLREGGCDAAVGAAERGTHLTASRRPGGYTGLPLSALRCSPAPMRPVRALPSCLGSGGASRALEHKLPLPARLRAGGHGSEWAAPSSAGESARSDDRRRLSGRARPLAALPAPTQQPSIPRKQQRSARGPMTATGRGCVRTASARPQRVLLSGCRRDAAPQGIQHGSRRDRSVCSGRRPLRHDEEHQKALRPPPASSPSSFWRPRAPASRA
jgi:hypothetical protein